MIGAEYPTLARLADAQLAAFPAHEGYLARRFSQETPDQLAFAEELAAHIAAIIGGDLDGYVADYAWLVGIVVEEEIVFRRTGKYRLSTFEEANTEIYADKAYMTRYMNGLLMSQLWWRNHTEVMRYFKRTYLSGGEPGQSHLEIGPGHGLFLYYAATNGTAGHVTGWDVSEASVALVRKTFKALDLRKDVPIELVNMFDAPGGQFDSIVFSEVLEHLEQPGEGLAAVFNLLRPGGRAFINAPVNSPAPDHLALFKSPEEIVDLVEAAGFEIVDTLFSPTSGSTLDRARKLNLAISTAVVAKRPEK